MLVHLVADEARRRGRRFGLLIVDLEAQYQATIDHIIEITDDYADVIDLHWIALPLSLRNAVSQFEPKWMCWDPCARDAWVREPPKRAITDIDALPFFHQGMEFEEFIVEFGRWYSGGKLCAALVGVRADESLNRYRSIVRPKRSFEGLHWTTKVDGPLYNAYPIYDWRTEDIWRYNGIHRKRYNRIYDLMHQAGVSIHQQRLCQPYGDDQRRGLWMYHILEPATWPKVVRRVQGANQGALYANERGSVSGLHKVSKPDALTWREYADTLLASMPDATAEHYRNKIAVFLRWYEDRGYPGGIPDDGPTNDRGKPSWARICKALLRNDYWCKGLSFSQTKSDAYDRYKKIMERRRRQWGLI